MNNAKGHVTTLKFSLDVVDEWPPVAVESLPFMAYQEGYRAMASPLFVKDLSVDDVIEPRLDSGNVVHAWRHLSRSGRTTIWLLRLKQPNGIDSALKELRALGCNSVAFAAAGCYAVDVPETVSIKDVDAILCVLDGDSVAVAFPSMRHPE